MTLSEFKFYEQEVVDFVNYLLDKVKEKNFSEYVLLLSRASYQVENENTCLSPYVIQSNLEIMQDMSRQQFLHTYLNQYIALLSDNVFMSNEIQEFNINIQLMIYSHVWESHRFLMNLKRISSILSGKGYEWRISFERPQKKSSNKKIPSNKGKMIKEKILEPLCSFDEKIGTFISGLYDSTIRNGYAHSLYQINMDEGNIRILKSETYSVEKEVNFFDWETTFFYSVLLSYHLTKSIIDRLNSFMEDYPEIKQVTISWPSFKKPGHFYQKSISPIMREYQGKKFVEFTFEE